MFNTIIMFLFGLIVGSFLNVCIFRMPRGISVVKPRSFCPNCKKMIRWYENIPLLSYIALRGECPNCKARISFRYFFVELITGIGFLALYFEFSLTLEFFAILVLMSGLIIATFVDIDFREIPDEVTMGGMVVGLLFGLIKSFTTGFSLSWNLPIVKSLVGLLVGGGVLYLTGLFGNFLFFKLMKRDNIDGETESMGGGDIKLLAMIGSFLGWEMALLVFFIAPFIGSFAGIYELVKKKKHTIPYGPSIALASVISIFWVDRIVFWLFGIRM
ncbi:MAG: prepilin peptidase [Candidatus Gygaella obscura]|nr:prepilin peptidase [Candidatus Gygaella obscura]